jgi:hypothetical protein
MENPAKHKLGRQAMINQIPSSQPTLLEGSRAPTGMVGASRPAGAVPPAASGDLGPANPRLRIDRDLGMVVIEFRDAAGRVSVSLPTPREIEAYRASILFGADLPNDVAGLNVTPGAPSAARPGMPLPSADTANAGVTSEAGNKSSATLDKVI